MQWQQKWSLDMFSKLAADLIKEGVNVQANIAAAGIIDSCDLPSNLTLHINKHARFGQSLLGYTDIAIYLVFN